MRASDPAGHDGETALQVAIVLLSIALVAGSRKIVMGALFLALAGIGVGLLPASAPAAALTA